MRILHTSDWHLGRNFHGASLLSDQASVVERIADMVTTESIEVVIIAGDIYDRAIAPPEAVALFDDALGKLRATGAVVIAISGNHDSSIRVGVYDSMLASVGVTIRGDVIRSVVPVIVESSDGAGPVAIYPLPYLDPPLVGPSLQKELDLKSTLQRTSIEVAGPGGGESAAHPLPRRRYGHDEVMRLAIARIQADLSQRRGARSILVAHTFAAGGATCDSERELTVGNIEMVGVDAFAGFDYVALGHLHGSQERDGPRVAYSGTPLAYSFSEENHTKSVRIVELAPNGTVTVEVVPLSVGRPLCTIKGTLDDLLSATQFTSAESARVRAYLLDDALPIQAMARLRKRFEFAAELHHTPVGRNSDVSLIGAPSSGDAATPPLELMERFWASQHGREATDLEAELFATALGFAASGNEE